eukprot:1725607-Rhodomonas_salina.1
MHGVEDGELECQDDGLLCCGGCQKCEGCDECVCVFMKEERCTGLLNENPLKALWNAIAVKTEEPDDVAPKNNTETEEKTKLPRGHHVKYDRAFQDRA